MTDRIANKYDLERPLGKGGWGAVYAAKNVRTGRRVAIKILNIHGLSPKDPEFQRFEQEARIAGSLESQHIAQVLDIEYDAETRLPFLVMELLRGEDLQALLDRVGPLPTDIALRIAAQACAGLQAAHAADVIHRDVKPANLFLARREGGEVVVKVLDFGVAKIRRPGPDGMQASGALTAPATSMTESGQVLGSPLFMPPEQVEGSKHVDARSDVYSMGVVLYAMLTGAAPHAEIKSLVRLLHALLNEPPEPLRTSAPWLPPEVAAVVDKALTHAPEGRFASATAMLEAIRALLPEGSALREEMLVGVSEEERQARASAKAEVPRAASAALTQPSAAQGSSRKWGWVIAVVVALGALVAAALLGR